MATIPTQNAVPSEAPRDLKFNSGKIDEFVTSLEHEYKDRFGRCHMTIEGMRWIFEQLMERFKVDINQAIIAAGYIPMDSFQQGAEITKRNEILRDETTGEYYRWDGDLPKSVPAGSTPESAGGVGTGAWVNVGDASLRSDLSLNNGVNLIGGKGDIPSKFDSLELMGAADLYVGDTAIVDGTKYIICGESRPFNASLHTIRTKHGYATASNLLNVIIRTPKLEFTVTSQADFQFPSSLQGSYYLDRTNQILLVSTIAESGSVNQSSKVIVYDITGSTLTEAYRTSSISMAHGDRFAIQDDGVDYYLWAAIPNASDYVNSSYNIKRFKLDSNTGNDSFDINIPMGGTFYQYLSDFNYDSFLIHNYTLNTLFEVKHDDLLAGEYKPNPIANGLETVKQLNHGGGQYFIYSPAEKKWLGLGGLDARTNRNGMCFISKFNFDADIDYATLLKTDAFDFGQEPQSFFYKYNTVKSAYDIYVCIWSSGDSSVRIYNVTDESTNPVKEIYYGGFTQNEYVASYDIGQYEGKSTVLESRFPLSARSVFIGGNAGNAQNNAYNPADFQLSQVAGSLDGTRRIASIEAFGSEGTSKATRIDIVGGADDTTPPGLRIKARGVISGGYTSDWGFVAGEYPLLTKALPKGAGFTAFSQLDIGLLSNVKKVSLLSITGVTVGCLSGSSVTIGEYSTTSGATSVMYSFSKGSIAPQTDNTSSLGTNAFRFTQLHAANGAIVTSDASYKVDVNDFTDAEKAVATKLRSLVKKYRMRESVENKGEKARWHIGIIAQEVIKAFKDEGLDAFSYGMICNSTWDNIYDDEGRLIKEAGSRYGVRYDELLCFIIASI